MTTPEFDYRQDGYVPELLEHYLKRFEELLSSSQLPAVNAGGAAPENGIVHQAAGSMYAHNEFEQDIRQEIYSRFLAGGEPEGNDPARQAEQNGYRGESDNTEILREVGVRLEDLIRAVEHNTERLSEQNQSSLEIGD